MPHTQNVFGFQKVAKEIAYREMVKSQFKQDVWLSIIEHQIESMYKAAECFNVPRNVLETEVKYLMLVHSPEELMKGAEHLAENICG